MSRGVKKGAERKVVLQALSRLIMGPRPIVAQAFEDASHASSEAGELSLEAVAAKVAGDTDAYLAALERADAGGWLRGFCVELLKRDAIAAGNNHTDFVRHIRALFGEGGALQRTFDPNNVAHDPCVEAARQFLTAPQLCRIDIDGKPAGTGFLVKPHLVLTAHHVVSPLVDRQGRQLPDTRPRLTIVFDDRRQLVGSAVTPMASVPVGVADQWLVNCSECHPDEIISDGTDDYADKLHETDGPWDYALIRLEKIVSLACKGLPLGSQFAEGEAIAVYHHREGKSLEGGRGTVHSVLNRGVRFRHTVNTKDGSSGGPCLNSMFEVIGIHQAGGDDKGLPNRAVPIGPIRGRISTLLQDPPPELQTILALSKGEIVMGRDDTQQWVWRAVPKEVPAQPAGDRILVIKGSKGRGKKLTLKIIRTLLGSGPHIVVDLDGGNMVGDTPLSFARKLLLAFNADPAVLPTEENLTTGLKWTTSTLIKAAIDAIGAIRGDRTVWIGIQYPEDGDLPNDAKIRPALDAFYAQVSEVPWLRLVLLGLQVDMPNELIPYTTVEVLRPLRAADVVTYFESRWTATGKAADRTFMEELADHMVTAAGGDDDPPPPEYHARLAAAVTKCVAKMIKKLGG